MPVTPDPTLKSFGSRLATIRKSKGITQRELAAAVGMTTVGVAYIEGGERWMWLETLVKIAAVLEVDVAELFRGV